MEESITYQEIFGKGEAIGRLEEARDFTFLIGTERWGAPDASIKRKLRAIDDLTRLHKFARCIYKARSWKDLFATK